MQFHIKPLADALPTIICPNKREGRNVVSIHSEMRVTPEGEPEVWANLGDILDWLDTLPENTSNCIAGAVASEIRQMLFESVDHAEVITK